MFTEGSSKGVSAAADSAEKGREADVAAAVKLLVDRAKFDQASADRYARECIGAGLHYFELCVLNAEDLEREKGADAFERTKQAWIVGALRRRNDLPRPGVQKQLQAEQVRRKREAEREELQKALAAQRERVGRVEAFIAGLDDETLSRYKLDVLPDFPDPTTRAYLRGMDPRGNGLLAEAIYLKYGGNHE